MSGTRFFAGLAICGILVTPAWTVRNPPQDLTTLKVSVKFENTDFKDAIRKLFSVAGMSSSMYEFAPDVKGNVSLQATDADFETVLLAVCKQADTTWRSGGPFMFVNRAADAPATPFALRNGDRVVFYGDSITDNSAYCRDVEQFVVARYPNLNVRFFNAGVGGDRVSGGWMGPIDQRLTRDLFSRQPTVVTIMLGMNDAGYSAFDEARFNTYKAGYQHIVDRLHKEAPNARVWLFRPTPFDDVTRPFTAQPDGYNRVLLRYADFVSDLAKANGYGIVDQNQPLVDVVSQIKVSSPEAAPQVIPDRVHPGWQGDYVMAEQLLKAWGVNPVVSEVSIDAATLKALIVQGATLSDKQVGLTVSWTQTDDALPFFIPRDDKMMSLILANSDLDRQLNRERLTVTGLASGNYRLRIDGKDVGTFAADQLANGVDLGGLDTPMFEQAAALRNLIDRRNELWYQRWRQLDFNMSGNPSGRLEGAKKALDQLDDELASEQKKLAQPKPHRFEVVSAG